jgi:hypothetical protein
MLFQPFVRCWHTRRGPILTCRPNQERSGTAALTGTYCVCMDCGKQFAYDWQEMRFVDEEKNRFQMVANKAVGM